MKESWIPTVAGVLSILCGCLALLGFLFLAAFAGAFYLEPLATADEFIAQFVRIGFVLGAASCLGLGLLAIFGGVCSIQRRRWGWALTGAIAATVLCMPLGVAALILVVIAESDLRQLPA